MNEETIKPPRIKPERLRELAGVEDSVHAEAMRDAADEIERLCRKLAIATLALGRIGEFDKYEPAGPAATTARSTLSVLGA